MADAGANAAGDPAEVGAKAALTRRIAGLETEYGITCTLDG